MTDTKASSTLRNRKAAVEDASDSEGDFGTKPTDVTLPEAAAKASATESKKGVKENPKGSALPQVAAKTVVVQKQSRFRSIILSLMVASVGVLFKSAMEKVYPPNRELQIDQTFGSIQPNCWKISNIPGPEDIEIFGKGNLAFVSSDDRSWKASSSYYHRPSSKTSQDGGIFTLNLENKDGSPAECKLYAFRPDDFHPGGISTFTSIDSDTKEAINRLFVINHSYKGDTVEIFDYVSADNSLHHVKSVVSTEFVTPKDIVAVGKEHFYLTNNNGLSYKIGRVAEEVVGMSMGSVVYYNGSVATQVLNEMRHPQGIAVSADNTQLYVSSFANKMIHVYNRTLNLAESELDEDEPILIGTNIENINVDKETGDIYVAGHPKYPTYVRYQMGYEPVSPSLVVKAEKLEPENYIPRISEAPDLYFFPRPELSPFKFDVKDVFYSTGEDIAAASVAARWKNDVIIGSATGDHLLRCTVSSPTTGYSE